MYYVHYMPSDIISVTYTLQGNQIKNQLAKEQELNDTSLLYQRHSKDILAKLKVCCHFQS